MSAGALNWPKALEKIEAQADAELNALISETPAADYPCIVNVIRRRREKLPLDTGQTDQILGISLQILSFGAAGLALAIGFIDKISTFDLPIRRLLAVGGIFYAQLVVLSLVFLVLFLLYAHFRYPFLYFSTIGNAWPWFYYAAISPDIPRSPFNTARKAFLGGHLYARDLLGFAERILTESPAQQLRNELQQYFLLMSYQGYVHQFTLRLTNIFIYGIVGCAITGLVLGLRAILPP